jgi:hypothetical protein
MREHLGFLRASSAVVKVAAWIFLLVGLLGGVSIFLKQPAGYNKLLVLFGSTIYMFFFFLFYLIAKIADLLIKIIHEIKKE